MTAGAMTMSEVRGAHLHFDCDSGIAGDMTLGALIDLGVPIGVVREAIAAVGVDGRRLRAKRVVKAGIASVDVKVVTLGRVWEAVPGMITVAATEAEADPASPSTGGGSRGSESPAAALGTGTGAGAEHAHHGVVHSHGDHAHHAYSGVRKRIEGAAVGGGEGGDPGGRREPPSSS